MEGDREAPEDDCVSDISDNESEDEDEEEEEEFGWQAVGAVVLDGVELCGAVVLFRCRVFEEAPDA